MGITVTGAVRSVDHGTRWIVFSQDGGPERKFVYSRWAKFWHGTSDTSPIALKVGMKIQVKLHDPVIGPDHVTQIVLIHQTQTANRN